MSSFFQSIQKPLLIGLILTSCPAFSQPETKQNVAEGKHLGKLLIGAVLPLSGSQSAYGQEVLAGYEAALEWIQKHDPKLHSHMSLTTADDLSTPSGARAATEELLQKRASILLGSVTRWSNEEINKLALENRKPLIIPSLCTQATKTRFKQQFYSCVSTEWYGSQLASYLGEQSQFKKVSLIFSSNNEYSMAFAQGFISQAKKSKFQVAEKDLSHAQDILEQVLQEVLKSSPEAIILPTQNFSILQKAAQFLSQKKSTTPLITSERWSQRMSKVTYSPISFITGYNDGITTPEVEAFKKHFEDKVRRKPSLLAVHAYDAIMMAFEAFKKVQSTRSEELTRALSQLKEADSLLGQLKITESGFSEKSLAIVNMKGSNKPVATIF